MFNSICRSLIAAAPAGMLAVAVLSAPARAADLFVAGTIGEVYKGDSHTGGFEYFGGICLAPVHALAIDDANIYAGDLNGGILRLDLATGDFMDLFWVPGDATDIVVHDQDLLVSDSLGFVHRVDPMTGTLKSTLTSPITVQAMALDGDDLFIAGPLGVVYKGNAQTGDFEFFGGACLGPIWALALDDANIYAGDASGAILVFDLATGKHIITFSISNGVTALVMDEGDLLASESGGQILRVDPTSGLLIDTLRSPITVEAMEILEALIPGDLNGDGTVGVADLLILLASWGPCADCGACPADLNGDCTVGITDLLILFANWGA